MEDKLIKTARAEHQIFRQINLTDVFEVEFYCSEIIRIIVSFLFNASDSSNMPEIDKK